MYKLKCCFDKILSDDTSYVCLQVPISKTE